MSDDLKVYDSNGTEIPRWLGTENNMDITSSFLTGNNGHTPSPTPIQEAEQVRELRFVPPGKDTPGFARRQRRALEFRNELQKEATPELVDKLVVFLADYVRAESRQQAEELIWDATENDWNRMLEALTGGGNNEAAVPPPTSAT